MAKKYKLQFLGTNIPEEIRPAADQADPAGKVLKEIRQELRGNKRSRYQYISGVNRELRRTASAYQKRDAI